MWFRGLPFVVLALALAPGCGGTSGGSPSDAGPGEDAGGDLDAPGDAGGDSDGGGSDGGGSDGGGTDAGSGLCGSCGAPPANTCTDASHLRRYASAAGCEGTACVYPSHIVECPNGCANGACNADACATLSCTAAAPVCSGSTLTTSSASCSAGACAVSAVEQTCAYGCAAGACLGPTCGATTCDAPAPAACLDPKVLQGAAELGTCTTSTCTYAALQTLCSQGCFAGACTAGSTESIFMPAAPAGSWTSNLAFAVDAAGRPHLVGRDGSGRVIWRHLDEHGWKDVTVDMNLGTGVQVALALDPSGIPVIAYYEPTNRRLRYAELRGASFHIEEVSLTSPAGQNPSIAVDANGVRWIASNDGALGLRVARGQAGSWTFESLGTNYSGATQLAFDPTGVLHLVWGSARSLAVSSGAYSQPAAYHAARVNGAWQIDTISKQGLVFKRGLAFAANGDALVAYGVVSAVGQNDELRMRRYGATPSDVLIQSIGNWLNVSPLGLYDTRADAKFIYPNASTLVRRDGDFWTTATHDLPPARNLLDVVDGPDGRPRFLASLASNSPANVNGYAFVTPPACVPSCTGATCGSDGCGGTCGSCTNGEACGPDRQCSPWLEETVNAPALTTYPSRSMSFAMTPAGAHHMLLRYNFPERYYTSGSTQDTLFHMTDATGPWQLPTVQTVVGIPMSSYAQLQIAPSSLQLGATGSPEAVFAYGLQGYTWSIRHAIPGMQPWMTDWSNSAGQARPRLISVARNAAGITYVITQCGFYGDVVCVDRRDSAGNTQSTLTGNYALAASAAVDAAGHVHILWTHMKRVNSVSTVTLEYATNASGTMISTPIAGETAMSGSELFRPLLALGPNDEPHIAFVHVGTTTVRHGVRVAGSFVIADAPATGEIALAVDGTGAPAILAVDGTATLWRQSGGTWMSEAIPTNGDASKPWLAFDAANKPHVVFEDGSSVSRQLRLGWKP